MFKNAFVFIVDSYGDDLQPQLESLGLKWYENFEVTGAGGADKILYNSDWLNAENLLVFMSSFHGDVEPAVKLSRQIKVANPKARIIFRSNSEYSDDPVFEMNVSKQFGGDTILMTIVKDFLESTNK